MSLTKFVGSRQIQENSIDLSRLTENFLKGLTWQVSDDNSAAITGLALPDGSDDSQAATVGYVEGYVTSVANWVKQDNPTGYGQELRPADGAVKRIGIYNTDYGVNELYIENSNDTDNYIASSITVTVDSANYTNQTFIAHFGKSYYEPELQSRGAIFTDSSMYIGAYNATDLQNQPAFVSFIVGDDWYNKKEIFRLTTRGLEMPLSEKKFWYANGTTLQDHPSQYTSLFVDVATSEVYAGVPSQIAPVKVIEINNNLTLNGAQTIDGVAANAGDRVAVFGQTDKTENGIYIVSDSDWTRAYDVPEGVQVGGKIFIVQQGNKYADTLWVIVNDTGSDVVGTDELEVKVATDAVTPYTDVFYLSAADISNGYVDLSNVPNLQYHVDVYLNGIMLEEGATGDYTLNGSRVEFTSDLQSSLEVDDKLLVKYQY